jgi:hypothetical protein
MAPPTDGELHRVIGQLEGKLDGITATLKRVDERSAKRDELFQEVVDRLSAQEAHAQHMTEVARAFKALQQAVHDGKMQGKGVLLGFGLATAAGGATLTAFFKQLWLALPGG